MKRFITQYSFEILSFVALTAMCLFTSLAYAATTRTAHIAWTAPTKFTDGTAITGAISYKVTSGTATQTATTTSLDWPNAALGQCFTVSAIVNGIESVQTAPSCVGQQPNTPGTITITVTTVTTVATTP